MKDMYGKILRPNDVVAFIIGNKDRPRLATGRVAAVPDASPDIAIAYQSHTVYVSEDQVVALDESKHTSLSGVIKNAPFVHKRTVRIKPIEKHYEGPGEPPYVKYSCPVCHNAGNTHIGIPQGTDHCPLCNVSLIWDMCPLVGDRVVVTQKKPTAFSFPIGSVCVITNETEIGLYKLRIQNGNETCYYTADEFSILEEVEE